MILPEALSAILRGLHQAGHRAWIVGGAVRDHLLGLAPKDFDVEVYGATYDQLAAWLQQKGRVDLVGRAFGVIKLTVTGGATWDFSIPRRENKAGRHHRDFLASFDPSITPQEAAARRDFTINAMAWDPIAGELYDYFDGQRDLAERRLRAIGPAFAEDPLRVLRGMQFACRFDLTLDPATAALCHSIAGEYTTLARERVAEEWMKWAVKSTRPGRLIEYLEQAGWIEHFPAVAALRAVPQDPEWHPEGDVAVHTMLVVDYAARLGQEGDDRAVLLFAALAHDFGKPSTTALRQKHGQTRWTAYGHDRAGVLIARKFLTGIGIKHDIISRVEPLVECHLAHFNPGPIRRLAVRLAPASIEELLLLMEADHGGISPAAQSLREAAAKLQVESAPPRPLIQGRHVLPFFDNQPGPPIGKAVKAAYEAQLDGAFTNEAEALVWLASHPPSR